MSAHDTAHVPRQKPKSLHLFLRQAARALLPKNNDRRLARIFERLSHQRTVNDGWVTRKELATFWQGHPGPKFRQTSGPSSGTVSNAMNDLRDQINRCLNWSLPHFTLRLEADSKKKAKAYRLTITRQGKPWDFTADEAPHTNPVEFGYRFAGGSRHRVRMQVWPHPCSCARLDIEAVREPPTATWRPPSLVHEYHNARDAHFRDASAARKAAGLPPLHRGQLWGIKDLHPAEDVGAMSLRISTSRIHYPDYHFLSRQLDAKFAAAKKHLTYRQWLDLDHNPRDGFCPPCDALCVAVLLVVRRPRLTVFVAKQRPATKAETARWNVSAAGAASSSLVHVHEEKPDLKNQIHGVVARETGIKFSDAEIQWLGFTRSIDSGNSSVIALIDSPLTTKEVKRQFEDRPIQDDVDELLPVELAKAHEWLATIPASERCEFLELTLALTAIHFKRAQLC